MTSEKFDVIHTIKSAIHLSEIAASRSQIKFKSSRPAIWAMGNSAQYLRIVLTLLDNIARYIENKIVRIQLQERNKNGKANLRLAIYLPVLIKEERFPFKIDTHHPEAEKLDGELNRDLLVIRSTVDALGGKFLIQYKRSKGLCFIVLFDLPLSEETQPPKKILIYTYPETAPSVSITETRKPPLAAVPNENEMPISTASPMTFFNPAEAKSPETPPPANANEAQQVIKQQVEKEKFEQDVFIETQRVINEQNVLAQQQEQAANDQKAFQLKRDNEKRAQMLARMRAR